MKLQPPKRPWLEAIRLRERSGRVRFCDLTRQRVGIVDQERLDPVAWVRLVLHGDGEAACDDLEEAELVMSGDGDVRIVRRFDDDVVEARVGGRVVEDASFIEDLLGAAAAPPFGRPPAAVEAGPEALARSLRRLAEPAGLTARIEALRERMGAVRARRAALEQQLGELPQAPSDGAVEVVDPPALGELLEAIESTREVDHRLLTRRLELAGALDELGEKPARAGGVVSTVMLDELEQLAVRLDETHEELEGLRRITHRGSGFAGRALAGVFAAAGAGLTWVGHQERDSSLFLLGGGLAGVSLAFAALIEVVRFRRLVVSTRKAKRLRGRRSRLKKDAQKLCLRVGAPTDLDDVSPERLRLVVDRAAARETSRGVRAMIAPFIDTPAELKLVRRLHETLGRPLRESGEGDDGPVVPIVQASRAALRIASDWTRALRETSERVERASHARIKAQVEREVLEESIARVAGQEREVTAEIARLIEERRQARRRYARALRCQVLPWLRTSLGGQAPRGVGDDLTVEAATDTSASTNTLVARCAWLLASPDGVAPPWGKTCPVPGAELDDRAVRAWTDIVAHAHQAGRLLVTAGSAGGLERFRRLARGADVGVLGEVSWAVEAPAAATAPPAEPVPPAGPPRPDEPAPLAEAAVGAEPAAAPDRAAR